MTEQLEQAFGVAPCRSIGIGGADFRSSVRVELADAGKRGRLGRGHPPALEAGDVVSRGVTAEVATAGCTSQHVHARNLCGSGRVTRTCAQRARTLGA